MDFLHQRLKFCVDKHRTLSILRVSGRRGGKGMCVQLDPFLRMSFWRPRFEKQPRSASFSRATLSRFASKLYNWE
jgi:hypothetical protein